MFATSRFLLKLENVFAANFVFFSESDIFSAHKYVFLLFPLLRLRLRLLLLLLLLYLLKKGMLRKIRIEIILLLLFGAQIIQKMLPNAEIQNLKKIVNILDKSRS